MATNLKLSSMKNLYVGSSSAKLLRPNNFYYTDFNKASSSNLMPRVHIYNNAGKPDHEGKYYYWGVSSQGYSTIASDSAGTDSWRFGIKPAATVDGRNINYYFEHDRYLMEITVRNEGSYGVLVNDNKGSTHRVNPNTERRVSFIGGSSGSEFMFQFRTEGVASNSWRIAFKDIAVYDLYDDQLFPSVTKPSNVFTVYSTSISATYKFTATSPITPKMEPVSTTNAVVTYYYSGETVTINAFYVTNKHAYVRYLSGDGSQYFINLGPVNLRKASNPLRAYKV